MQERSINSNEEWHAFTKDKRCMEFDFIMITTISTQWRRIEIVSDRSQSLGKLAEVHEVEKGSTCRPRSLDQLQSVHDT